MNESWEELVKLESGTILHDTFEDGLRFIVMRGPASLCAYVGIPLSHPLANHSYEDLPVSAHGGLTFGSEGDDFRPKGFYWYGWDYSHSRDYAFYYDTIPNMSGDGKKWLVQDVINNSWETLYDFKKLLKLSEEIASRKD